MSALALPTLAGSAARAWISSKRLRAPNVFLPKCFFRTWRGTRPRTDGNYRKIKDVSPPAEQKFSTNRTVQNILLRRSTAESVSCKASFRFHVRRAASSFSHSTGFRFNEQAISFMEAQSLSRIRAPRAPSSSSAGVFVFSEGVSPSKANLTALRQCWNGIEHRNPNDHSTCMSSSSSDELTSSGMQAWEASPRSEPESSSIKPGISSSSSSPAPPAPL